MSLYDNREYILRDNIVPFKIGKRSNIVTAVTTLSFNESKQVVSSTANLTLKVKKNASSSLLNQWICKILHWK